MAQSLVHRRHLPALCHELLELTGLEALETAFRLGGVGPLRRLIQARVDHHFAACGCPFPE